MHHATSITESHLQCIKLLEGPTSSDWMVDRKRKRTKVSLEWIDRKRKEPTLLYPHAISLRNLLEQK